MSRLLALACLLALSTGPGNPPELKLRVRSGERIVWSAPIRAGEAFDIVFLHSSERCEWAHHFTAAADATIRQVSSTFPCYGPGMPAEIPAGTKLLTSAGGFTVAGPLVLHELRMMGSTRAALRMQYRNAVVPLGAMFLDFELFTISVEP